MPSTMDYTTQGDPNQVTPPVYINTAQGTAQNQFFHTNNFFIPDGSNRCMHKIRDKVFHAGNLENRNNAYLLELPGLKDMLHTSKFLMDEMSGQFYAVYGNISVNVHKTYVRTVMGNRRTDRPACCDMTSFWLYRTFRTNTATESATANSKCHKQPTR